MNSQPEKSSAYADAKGFNCVEEFNAAAIATRRRRPTTFLAANSFAKTPNHFRVSPHKLTMKNTPIYLIALAIFAASALSYAQTAKHNYVPPDGYVPNARTAIQIAVAVWTPIYGAKKIENEKPFQTKLVKGVWIVEGTLPRKYDVGGVAVAEISKQDGRILRVSHSK